MKLGLVLLNYNSSYNTIKCYDKARKIKDVDEIIVVDNNSNNHQKDKLADRIPKNEIILLDKNIGYSAGNNIGLKHLYEKSRCDILVVSNPDVVFDSVIFSEIKKNLAETDFSLLTGVMKEYNETISKKSYWDLTTYSRELITILTSYKKKNIDNHSIDYLQKIMKVECVPGSFFGIRSDVLSKIDYLDENVFLYKEEEILGAKLKMKGFKVGIITNCFYIHNHKPKLDSIKKYLQISKSRIYYQKVYNRINIIQLLFLYLVIGVTFCIVLILNIVKFIYRLTRRSIS